MRIDKFKTLYSHAWYSKKINSLPIKYIDFCLNFIKENESLPNDEFSAKVNRMLLGMEFKNKAEKNKWLLCQELIDCSIIK